MRAGVEAKLPFKAHPHMLRHACGFALADKETRALQAYLGTETFNTPSGTPSYRRQGSRTSGAPDPQLFRSPTEFPTTLKGCRLLSSQRG